MTKEFLHNLGVLPIGMEKRPKRVPECVIGHMPGDLGSLERRFAVVWPSGEIVVVRSRSCSSGPVIGPFPNRIPCNLARRRPPLTYSTCVSGRTRSSFCGEGMSN